MSIAVRRNYILKTCFDYLENCIISDGFYFIWSKKYHYSIYILFCVLQIAVYENAEIQ